MEPRYATGLIAAFQQQHPEFPTVDPARFHELLVATPTVSSTRFSMELPAASLPIPETIDVAHYLSLRRLLRNDRAEYHPLSGVKGALNTFVTALNGYSSTHLTRAIRTESGLVAMMQDSLEQGFPFSLLGKFVTQETRGDGFYECAQPLLIIPGARDVAPLHRWEAQHARYTEERRLGPFVWDRRLSPHQF